jgi:peptide/nickel transport system substrate-binding protein
VIAGAAGNAATRLESYLASTGTFAAGGSPDLDGLLQEQATERDRAKREAILKTVQQLVHERAMFAPLYDLAFVNGVAPRVEESGLGLIAGYAFSAPYEDVKLKAR